ncbi:phage holin family protein [Streptomyces sp. NRRL F-5126]|uniref:phage holin family protein n=1 Tax=Streptomyces sp. NRRL F-5126 TaxID=1463857 RepID=UPI0004CB0979|nr:phage holin family protein [Streptomyces sp. NRRL F-5126]
MSDPDKQVADALKTGTAVEAVPADRSLGQLVAAATAEMSELVHDEIALAKAELRQDVKKGAIGGAAGSVAGIMALFSLPMFSFAAAYGIHNLGLGLAWSFLIVAGAFVVIAALAGGIAALVLKKIKPPKKSIAAAKDTASVLQKAKPHPRELASGTSESKSVARSSA